MTLYLSAYIPAAPPFRSLDMGFTEKLLNIVSDPDVAYILLMLGLLGLLFELFNPGIIFPGIIGFISLVLAFYAFNTLPLNYAGLALIIFGVILLLLEIKIVSHGMLAIGGITALLIGSVMLIRPGSGLEVDQDFPHPDCFHRFDHRCFFPVCHRYGIESTASKTGYRHRSDDGCNSRSG